MQGAIDEAIRHSIAKMSYLHFVANNEYRSRAIRLGERPDAVFCVGGLAVHAIDHQNLLSREELEDALSKLRSRGLLLAFHPVTLENNTSAKQI